MTRTEPGDDVVAIRVLVVRSGGFAGLRREWRAEPAVDEAASWQAMLDECPWDDVTERSTGADRFVWKVKARTGDVRRTAELGDAQLVGPWRHLVDAVRDFADDD